jgi:hypothetical protein
MISRRELALGIASSLALPNPVIAGRRCQDLSNGLRRCTVGVETGKIIPVFQHGLKWCWAACIEAIFAFHGHRVDQRTIVGRMFFTDNDLDQGQDEKQVWLSRQQDASGPVIFSAINQQWTDDKGNSFAAKGELLWDTQEVFLGGSGRPDYALAISANAVLKAARELEAGNPLIFGALGHAVLLTALTYTNVGFDQAIVRDPMPLPGRPYRRQLESVEWANMQFLAKVEVS